MSGLLSTTLRLCATDEYAAAENTGFAPSAQGVEYGCVVSMIVYVRTGSEALGFSSYVLVASPAVGSTKLTQAPIRDVAILYGRRRSLMCLIYIAVKATYGIPREMCMS